MMAFALTATAVVILASMAIAFARTRDPLHPLIYIGPMLLYVYVARPGVLLMNGELERWIPNPDHLIFSQLLFSSGIALFCIGALRSTRRRDMRRVGPIKFVVSESVRGRMFRFGCLLGAVSIAVYVYMVTRNGGFLYVYSRSKATFSAGSGWISELVNLSIPAAGFLVLSWQGKPRHWYHLPLALLCGSPLLVHGLLGARRGPTFMILSTLVVSWYLASPRKLSLSKVILRFGAIGLVAIFLASHRTAIHIGSDFEFDTVKLIESIAPSEVRESDDTVFHYGFVNGIREYEKYFWGMRYVATYLVRPIPRQLWPTKYEDLGLGWMVRQSDFFGISEEHWIAVLGWTPTRGSAAGFVADLFAEFSFFGLAGCMLMGLFYGTLWRRAHGNSQLSILLYVQAAALSVYVPTQSVSAVFHRFLFVSVLTWIVWTVLGGRHGHTASLVGTAKSGFIVVRTIARMPSPTPAVGSTDVRRLP